MHMSVHSIVKLSLILVALGLGLGCMAGNQREKIWQKNESTFSKPYMMAFLKRVTTVTRKKS